MQGGSDKVDRIEADQIVVSLHLVTGHESQPSHCAQSWMKLWHLVVLCEFPFCTERLPALPNCCCPKIPWS
jgi:hypothetical protein